MVLQPINLYKFATFAVKGIPCKSGAVPAAVISKKTARQPCHCPPTGGWEGRPSGE